MRRPRPYNTLARVGSPGAHACRPPQSPKGGGGRRRPRTGVAGHGSGSQTATNAGWVLPRKWPPLRAAMGPDGDAWDVRRAGRPGRRERLLTFTAELRAFDLRMLCASQHDHSSLGNSFEGMRPDVVSYLPAGQLPTRRGELRAQPLHRRGSEPGRNPQRAWLARLGRHVIRSQANTPARSANNPHQVARASVGSTARPGVNAATAATCRGRSHSRPTRRHTSGSTGTPAPPLAGRARRPPGLPPGRPVETHTPRTRPPQSSARHRA